MARYKHQDYNQTKMIPLRLADQIQPGRFEYTLNHVVDNELDLSHQMGLIGREMFAIDGCKLLSNVPKEWSGTRAELRSEAIRVTR